MVSLLLSVQTNDKTTDSVYWSLFKKVKSVEELESMDEESLLMHIKPVNFSTKKAAQI